jgi:cytochrome c oxidase subunit 2
VHHHSSERSRARRRRILIGLTVALALVLAACGTDLPQNSLEPAGPEARKINDLFTLVFWIAVAVFVAVEAALIFVIVKYRRGRGPDRDVKQVHGSTRLEVTWTIIPVVVLAIVAVPTLRTIFDLRSEPDPAENALVVNVVGHQWWWEFEYPEYGIRTANELHIPADRAVYLNITSADVIHSFWVPQLNGKRDAVPGRWNHLTIEADEPGTYLGQCAEFCGLAHADMRHRVLAHTEADFEAWALAMQQPAVLPTEGLAAQGWETFQVVCAACHTVDDHVEVNRTITVDEQDYEVALAPVLTHYGSRTTFGGASFENTAEHLAEWLADPSALKPMDPDRNIIEEGRILGMPNFGLDGTEIDGLVALLQSFTLEWEAETG